MSNGLRLAALTGMLALGALALGSSTRGVAAQRAGFIAPNSCYRIAFPIESPPNYKVLEVLDDGWIRAEVDAGPASAKRPSMWINTAQIISMRQVPCSE